MILTRKRGGRASLPKGVLDWRTVMLPPIDYQITPNRSERTRPIKGIVVHYTAGSYSGAVKTLLNPHPGDAGGPRSAHLVLREDGRLAAQLVPWHEKAWHARGFNEGTLGLEIASSRPLDWPGPEEDDRNRWTVAARIVAYWCAHYNVPARRVVWDGDVDCDDRPGVARHADAGGGTLDPMPSGLFNRFIVDVHRQVERGGFLPWGVQ